MYTCACTCPFWLLSCKHGSPTWNCWIQSFLVCPTYLDDCPLGRAHPSLPFSPSMAQWPCPLQRFLTQPSVDGGPPIERAHGCECLPVCRALAQPLPVFLSSASLGNFILQVPEQKIMQARVKRLSRGHAV